MNTLPKCYENWWKNYADSKYDRQFALRAFPDYEPLRKTHQNKSTCGKNKFFICILATILLIGSRMTYMCSGMSEETCLMSGVSTPPKHIWVNLTFSVLNRNSSSRDSIKPTKQTLDFHNVSCHDIRHQDKMDNEIGNSMVWGWASFVMLHSGAYLGIPTTLLVDNFTLNPNFLADDFLKSWEHLQHKYSPGCRCLWCPRIHVDKINQMGEFQHRQ